ncbi:putative nucleotidyltransferase, ribonuclease H [Tanacetum coccineum]
MDSPPNHECEQALDIEDFDLRLTPVVRLSNNPHILPETATTTQTLFLSQNHQVDNYVVNPVRIIPGPASIVKTAKLHKIADTREGVEESLMSIQEYIRKVIEDIMTGCFGDVKKFLKNGKLEKVVAIIKSFTPNALGDLTVTLKDLSNTIFGTVHYKVLTD